MLICKKFHIVGACHIKPLCMGYMGLYAQGKRETGANPVRTRHCD